MGRQYLGHPQTSNKLYLSWLPRIFRFILCTTGKVIVFGIKTIFKQYLKLFILESYIVPPKIPPTEYSPLPPPFHLAVVRLDYLHPGDEQAVLQYCYTQAMLSPTLFLLNGAHGATCMPRNGILIQINRSVLSRDVLTVQPI